MLPAMVGLRPILNDQLNTTDSEAPSQPAQKLKAANFPASSLRIGMWERTSRLAADLVAKIYFARKKLIWELLSQNGLKSKIEIQWSDISGLSFVTRENEPGILAIELRNPPSFHHEVDPMPKKHTFWKPSQDFTDGQATNYRMHLLTFSPGILENQIKKLLQCEPRFLNLSRQRFPTTDYPFFNSHTSNLGGHPECGPERLRIWRDSSSESINANRTLVTAKPVHSYASRVQPYLKTTPSPITRTTVSVPGFSNYPERGQGLRIWRNSSQESINSPFVTAQSVHSFASAVQPCLKITPSPISNRLQEPGYLSARSSQMQSNQFEEPRYIPTNPACSCGMDQHQEPGYIPASSTDQLQEQGYLSSRPIHLSQMENNYQDDYSRDQLQERIVPTNSTDQAKLNEDCAPIATQEDYASLDQLFTQPTQENSTTRVDDPQCGNGYDDLAFCVTEDADADILAFLNSSPSQNAEM